MKKDFMDALKRQQYDFSIAYTENGAAGYQTTGKALLDLNFEVASYRSKGEYAIVKAFSKAYMEDARTALVWLFYCRDPRGGLGERAFFRTVMEALATEVPELVAKLVPLISVYGRWDDMNALIKAPEAVSNAVVWRIKQQFASDEANMLNGEPVSLLAKWMPSENASSQETRSLARKFAKELGMRAGEYRKRVSRLRKYIDVVERKMSGNQWGEIKYETVPSRAGLIYKDAFLRHDEKRRKAYLDALERGETKINASVLFPHDIVHKYMQNIKQVYLSQQGFSYGHSYGYLRTRPNITIREDVAFEAMWKALPRYVTDADVLVVRDGSGSMDMHGIGRTEVTALDVATGLAIYFSEMCNGIFKDTFITFSESPRIVDLSNCKSLAEKIAYTTTFNEASNTDIEKTFDLILSSAVSSKASQKDLPGTVLIISDMEFDAARAHSRMAYGYYRNADQNSTSTLFDTIREKFEKKGYKLPKLAFWNVNSRTGTIPMRENENGLVLVSGFSPSITKMVMSDKLDPYDALMDALNDEKYDMVRMVIKEVLKL